MAEKRDRTLHILGGLVVGFGLGWFIKNLVYPHIEEEEEPEPGLIVISPKKTYTRGFEGYHNLNFKSTVDSVTQVKLMLVDPEGIFDTFDVCYRMLREYPRRYYLFESILNKFQDNHLWQTEDKYDFPVRVAKTFMCGGGYMAPWHYGIKVKPNAPIGVHDLTFRVKYVVHVPGLGKAFQEEVEAPWKVTVYPIDEGIWETTITEEALRAPILLYPEVNRK